MGFSKYFGFAKLSLCAESAEKSYLKNNLSPAVQEVVISVWRNLSSKTMYLHINIE